MAATSAGARYDKLLKLRFKAGGKTVEGSLDESVRCARRHISTSAGRQHVQRNRVVRLFFEPFFEDVHGLADVAQRAVRERQKPSRFPVLRPERDHLAVARRGFLVRFNPLSRMPRLVYASMCSGFS